MAECLLFCQLCRHTCNRGLQCAPLSSRGGSLKDHEKNRNRHLLCNQACPQFGLLSGIVATTKPKLKNLLYVLPFDFVQPTAASLLNLRHFSYVPIPYQASRDSAWYGFVKSKMSNLDLAVVISTPTRQMYIYQWVSPTVIPAVFDCD